MKLFICLISFLFSFSLISQEPSLVPPGGEEEETEETEETEEEEKESEGDTDYQDLYKQYLNKFSKSDDSEEETEKAEQEEAEKTKEKASPKKKKVKKTAEKEVEKSEEEPEEKEVAEPETEEKTEDTEDTEKKVAEKPEEKTEEKPEEKEVQLVKEPVEKVEKKPAKPRKKLAEKPFLNLNAFAQSSTGLKMFGSEIMSDSFNFMLDNAVFDIRGGYKYFEGVAVFDFARTLSSRSTIAPNYAYNSNNDIQTETPDIQLKEEQSDLISDAYFLFYYPDWTIEIKGGKFNMPFGVETTVDYASPWYYHSLVREQYLSGGFNDLGIQIGSSIPIMDNTDLKIRGFLFNGTNKNHLDGEEIKQQPAFGFDARFIMEQQFHLLASLSMIYGPAYHPYKTYSKDGENFKDTDARNKYYGNSLKYSILAKSSEAYGISGEDGSFSEANRDEQKGNVLFAIGTDIGYNITESINAGLEFQYIFSYRNIYNPVYSSDGMVLNLVQDGLSVWEDSSYTSFALSATPYFDLYDFSLALRFSYHKQPYLYAFLLDDENYTLGLDVMTAYTFFDFLEVGLNFRWKREAINLLFEDSSGNLSQNYYENQYNHVDLLFHMAFEYGMFFEKN